MMVSGQEDVYGLVSLWGFWDRHLVNMSDVAATQAYTRAVPSKLYQLPAYGNKEGTSDCPADA